MSTGKYEKVGEAIGDGSYWTVWKGIDQETSRQVAMKQVKIPNEMRTLRALTHPNIVKMHEVYTESPGSEGSPDDIYFEFECKQTRIQTTLALVLPYSSSRLYDCGTAEVDT